jgi:enoyl-CoA hydratase/carnithine racemase
MTGRKVDAAEALRIGPANAVFDDAELLDATFAKAAEIVADSPSASR